MITVCFNLVLLIYTALYLALFRKSRLHILNLLAMGMLGQFTLSLLSSSALSVDIFGVMALMCWSLFLHLPIFLVAFAILRLRAHKPVALTVTVGALFILAVGADAFLIEPHWLDVTHVTVTSDKLDQTLRIAVLADIQTDTPGGYEANVFARVKAERPDLILFLGDTLQTPEKDFDDAAEKLNTLLREADFQPPLGLFAIQGNVDPDAWTAIFSGLGITTLWETQTIDIGPLTLTGLSFADSRQINLTLDPKEKFHLVMGHCPDYALGQTRADLMLAGHTHGGQVRLPGLGPLLTFSNVPKAWASGLTEVTPGQYLYVSRGIGMERGTAPRLRFLCRPELLILTLAPETH
jgi:predicted MPP superfamily phosphohydrolase